jgi:hypothetical protein
MRKVKFTQDTFDEKLGAILSEFPMLDVYRHFTLCPTLVLPSRMRTGLASVSVLSYERLV